VTNTKYPKNPQEIKVRTNITPAAHIIRNKVLLTVVPFALLTSQMMRQVKKINPEITQAVGMVCIMMFVFMH
jgi:hypothetical protein